MATAPALPFVSVGDYLRTEYEAYCEYVGGVLVPKRIPGDDHSSFVEALVFFISHQKRQLGLHVRPERHIRINETRYRIPDLAVFTQRDAQGTARIAPLVTFEVVSPDETWLELNHKIRDHLAMGVGTAIVVDPHSCTVFVATTQQPLHQLTSPLRIEIDVPNRGTLHIDFDQVFADMD